MQCGAIAGQMGKACAAIGPRSHPSLVPCCHSEMGAQDIPSGEGASRGEGFDEPLYSIGAVAKMLAVPASTLRAWEERYGVITPRRSLGSQRLYSRSQVEQLRFVKAQIERGLSAADAHRLLVEELKAGHVAALLEADVSAPRWLVLIAER